jgi:16S rRNA (uracil1498-N3)-methyltransferase
VQRFFVPPESIANGRVTFSPGQSRQLAAVIRLAVGERCVVLDDTGWEYEVKIATLDMEACTATIVQRRLASGEPRLKVTLFQALIRGPRFELVLQKGAEIGIAAIVPIVTQRCVVAAVTEHRASKSDRWRKIMVEAAEQSGRGRVPVLRPTTLFEQACADVRGLSVIPWELEKDRTLTEAVRTSPDGTPRALPLAANVFIGPEGGFTEDEIALARKHGIVPVTLGARILRAETAAIVTTTLILAASGDVG